VRKIISILVALGLVLAFSVVAMPTSAANTCSGTVEMVSGCAGATDTYTINFTSPVTLLAGNDGFSVTFGAGTSLAGVNSSYVTVADLGPTTPFVAANPTSVTKTGTKIEFPVPATVTAGDKVQIVISNVVNPAGGTYTMVLDYKLLCCGPFDFCTVEYKIKPAVSTYKLNVDFGPTYPGIAKDFVPPFKACGQNDTADTATVLIDGKWYDQFNLNLVTDVVGCALPCTNFTLFVDLLAYPSASAVASLNISGEFHALNSTSHNATFALNLTPADPAASVTLLSLLHFDTVGKGWQIKFKVFCPPTGVPVCPLCLTGSETLIAEKTYTFDVYQWKDAAKITLKEKWNLISLPLVPLVDPPVATTLASIPAADLANVLSIWHYDRCADKWEIWAADGSQTSLTELVDGEAYWVRVKYPLTPDCGNITLWVWGTEKPMPPAAPAQYPVCEGWNMVGFLGLAPLTPASYLWNWGTPTPVVYGWDQGCWNLQGWNLINGAETLMPGQGYWVAFPADGAIYVP